MRVVLWRVDGTAQVIAEGMTNSDGRVDRLLLPEAGFAPGTYQLEFHVGDYHRSRGYALADPSFLDVVPVRFGMTDDRHYHVPLLISPYGYSTYRGS